MTLGERIGNKRRAAGLSQEEPGNILGVTRQSIYKWENDQAVPELDNLLQLSKVFEVTAGWSTKKSSLFLTVVPAWMHLEILHRAKSMARNSSVVIRMKITVPSTLSWSP